nr:class I SAM-dependent methyltransferase [Quadrisphaera granulorum]
MLDVGCGPGHFTAHLARLGVDAVGVDLSPGMVRRAQRDHADVHFEVGSMASLTAGDGTLAGILAWYSLIHAPDDDVVAVLGEFYRALRPGGILLVAWHVGDEVRLKTQGYGGLPMHVNVHRRSLETMCAWLMDAGFDLLQSTLREPTAEVPQGRLLARRQ